MQISELLEEDSLGPKIVVAEERRTVRVKTNTETKETEDGVWEVSLLLFSLHIILTQHLWERAPWRTLGGFWKKKAVASSLCEPLPCSPRRNYPEQGKWGIWRALNKFSQGHFFRSAVPGVNLAPPPFTHTRTHNISLKKKKKLRTFRIEVGQSFNIRISLRLLNSVVFPRARAAVTKVPTAKVVKKGKKASRGKSDRRNFADRFWACAFFVFFSTSCGGPAKFRRSSRSVSIYAFSCACLDPIWRTRRNCNTFFRWAQWDQVKLKGSHSKTGRKRYTSGLVVSLFLVWRLRCGHFRWGEHFEVRKKRSLGPRPTDDSRLHSKFSQELWLANQTCAVIPLGQKSVQNVRCFGAVLGVARARWVVWGCNLLTRTVCNPVQHRFHWNGVVRKVGKCLAPLYDDFSMMVLHGVESMALLFRNSVN